MRTGWSSRIGARHAPLDRHTAHPPATLSRRSDAAATLPGCSTRRLAHRCPGGPTPRHLDEPCCRAGRARKPSAANTPPVRSPLPMHGMRAIVQKPIFDHTGFHMRPAGSEDRRQSNRTGPITHSFLLGRLAHKRCDGPARKRMAHHVRHKAQGVPASTYEKTMNTSQMHMPHR